MSSSNRRIKKNAKLHRLAAGIYDTIRQDGAIDFYREITADGNEEYIATLADGSEIRGNYAFIEAIQQAGNFRACRSL